MPKCKLLLRSLCVLWVRDLIWDHQFCQSAARTYYLLHKSQLNTFFIFSVKAYFLFQALDCVLQILGMNPALQVKGQSKCNSPWKFPIQLLLCHRERKQLQVAIAAPCQHALNTLSLLGKGTCNSTNGFFPKYHLVLPNNHLRHGLLCGASKSKAGRGAGCLTCRRMRDACQVHNTDKFKSGTLHVSHIFPN